MNVTIVASKRFNNYEYMKMKLDELEIKLLICRGDTKIEEMLTRYSNFHKIPVKTINQNTYYNNKSTSIQKLSIIESCDLLIAFHVDKSIGTQSIINLCVNKHKSHIIYEL